MQIFGVDPSNPKCQTSDPYVYIIFENITIRNRWILDIVLNVHVIISIF